MFVFFFFFMRMAKKNSSFSCSEIFQCQVSYPPPESKEALFSVHDINAA